MASVVWLVAAVMTRPVCAIAEDVTVTDSSTKDGDENSVVGGENRVSADVANEESPLIAETSGEEESVPTPKPGYRIYAGHHDISAKLETSEGTLCCDLFMDDHPLTVLNFKALATGHPAWTDRQGISHDSPYYDMLAFDRRDKNAFAVVSARPEGTNFVIEDERCAEHGPVAGAIVMIQPHPGAASTQFALLARDLPELHGMFTTFGQCHDVELIKKITASKSVLQKVTIYDNVACHE